MQTQIFTKTKIALAVGSVLMVMAGTAAAATPPANRGTNPDVVSALGVTNDANIRSLLSATGLSGQTVTVSANLSNGVTTAGIGGDIQAVLPGAPTVLVTALNVADATLANRNVLAYTGTLGASTVLPMTSATFVPDGTSAAGTASINVVLTAPAAPAAYRMNAGNLEYTSNNGTTGGTAVAFAPVKLDVQAATAVGAIIYTENTGAVPAGAATAGYVAAEDQIMSLQTVSGTIKSNLAPTPTIATTSASGGALINGFAIDTGSPIVLAAANLGVKTTSPGASGFVAGTTFPAASMGAPVCATSKCTVTFAGLGTTATAAGFVSGAATATAADAAAYISDWFNTGVNGATVPFNVDGTATEASYTEVFNVTDGVASKLAISTGAVDATHAAKFAAPAGNVITDGAAPVIVTGGINFSTPSAATPSLTNLTVKFSEPLVFTTGVFGDANNLREVLENVFVGTATLAELSLNSGVTPSLVALATANGQGVVQINNVASADVATLAAGVWTGKSMSVSRGISYQEVNDTGYAANILAGTLFDDDSGTGPNGEELMGGVKSASGVVEAIPSTAVAQTAVAPAATIAWGTDTSALASASSAASPDLIDTVTVTFAAGKSVKLAPAGTTFGTATALASAKTNADLAANLVVDVFGSNGIKFQVKPLSATLDTANQITVKVPTALIYSKLTNAGAQLKSVWIGYVADGNNKQNNTLVATDAASTLASPIRVAQGIVGSGGAWGAADLTAAGAEPVVLPLVFTATQTAGQSTLLTQNIQSNIAGSVAGSIVTAYLGYWVDFPKVSPTVATVDSGKITNPGDRVATDLAIEFVSVAGATEATGVTLAAAIQTELGKATPAVAPKPGVTEQAAPIAANNIPVYVKFVRSNDNVQTSANTAVSTNNSQGYLNARAFLATSYGGAKAAGSNDHDNTSPIYEVQLNPTTGDISGRLNGKVVFKTGKATTTARGLRFLNKFGKDAATAAGNAIGSSLVAAKSATGLALPGTANVNLLMGIDPQTTDFGSITALNPFVLLTHRDSTGKYTLLTSADPTAANYMPFEPELFNKKVGTGGVAVRATTPLSVTDVREYALPKSALWALYGLGNPATKVPAQPIAPDKAFPRMFVGLDTVSGEPESFWTTDGAAALPIAKLGDIAMAIAGNNVGVATELTSDTGSLTGPTLSNIGAANQVKAAAAIAWANERGFTDGATAKLGRIFVAQATGAFAPAVTPAAPKVAPGWSLVTVPGTVGSAGTLNASVVDAVIKVGAQVGIVPSATPLTVEATKAGDGTGQFTWFAVDGAMPTLTAGEAVFVHAKTAGNL